MDRFILLGGRMKLKTLTSSVDPSSVLVLCMSERGGCHVLSH